MTEVGAPLTIKPGALPGMAIVEPQPFRDERGEFMRTFDAEPFAANGLDARVAQCSSSFNLHAGTLRGLHYQLASRGECKLVRCVRGSIFDVIVDLRRDSPTHCRWVGIELSAENRLGVFIPTGCAHGFQTLVPNSQIHYQMSVAFVAEADRGVCWNDPAFAIRWPAPSDGERTINARDRAFPAYIP